MHCPKCQQLMEAVTTPRGTAYRCTGCFGLWFKMLAHEEMIQHAREIDTGDPKIGEKQNRIDRINCPQCANSPMLRMVDAEQPHIWFESCPVCHGRFFDAGEYRDLAEHSFSDLIKRFKVKARD